ncbi:hypothetical protein EJ063_08275 [Vibrio aquaticus]|uniref:Transporter substrate-binding domain-containing protein n=1 Tax=Vibrio aquaticus TaxID=2496559 RepID=A0A432CXZ1_9VIBR|nr:hypothetical protein [Vibrio aquaticus]RTZ16779.1 hypothetical protein EJ063_08275 [Vibrio aquaticus]
MKLWILMIVVVSLKSVAGESLTLVLPSQVDGGHRFYHELLYESLSRAGHKVTITTPSEHIPQKRVVKMVESNQLSLTWLISSKRRDQLYPSISVPLTNGLIGRRVLLIPPELQTRFDEIRSLEALRESNLVAGLGMNWFDVDVWKNNHLKVYVADGEWRSLYQSLSVDGEVNYFPRGINEASNEADLNSHLVVEKNLLLVYERDFKFYLSSATLPHQQLIEDALQKAKVEGVIDRLIDKYWGESKKRLNEERRVVINLELPES